MHPFYFATEHNISALTPHKVFSSLLLLKPANFPDIRWQPLSLQTPVVCWLAYPALLSHLEFPIKKNKQTTYKSITDCTSVLFWNADYSNEELLECTLPGVLSERIHSLVSAVPPVKATRHGEQPQDFCWLPVKSTLIPAATKGAIGAFLPCFHVTHGFTWKSPSKNNQGSKNLVQILLFVPRTILFCKQSLTNFCEAVDCFSFTPEK